MTEEQGAEQSPDANTDKKSFGKDVGKLVSGTVAAQVVGICLIPIITRIFSPEIFGVASVFISIVSIIVVIACMRYELAILLPKDDKDAGAVFLLCLIILVCVSLFTIPIMFLCGDLIASLLGNAAVKDYLFLVPIAVFIDGLYVTLRYWNTRRKRFGTQALTQALQSITGNGAKLGFGAVGFVVPGSLITGQILGNGFGTIILFWQVVRFDFKLISESFSLKNIKKQMVRYKKFPLIDAGNTLTNTVSWQVPVFMLSSFFSSSIVGLYSLGMLMIQMPMSFIGNSLRQVFLQRCSLLKHTGNFAPFVEETCSGLIILSLCPFLLLSIIGGDLFSLIFGSEWYEAGIYVQILVPWAIIWFVASIISELIYVLELQEYGFICSLISLILRFLSLLVGGLLGSVYIALFLFMVSGIFTYSGITVFLISKTKASYKKILGGISREILVSLSLFTIIMSLKLLFTLSSLITCIIGIGFGLIYYIYLLKYSKILKLWI
jgi:O-antigen/teichoic acid export membrane protein